MNRQFIRRFVNYGHLYRIFIGSYCEKKIFCNLLQRFIQGNGVNITDNEDITQIGSKVIYRKFESQYETFRKLAHAIYSDF